MTIEAPAPPRRGRAVLPVWARDPALLRRLAVASVVANVVIVVTGGAVRLTDSGLGCPTWPSCTDASLTPTPQFAAHGIIEFSNRMLTFVLVLVAVATWAAAMVQRTQRPLATVALLGIPAQAVLGGITVLTHLNPWFVAAHFLLSAVILAVAFVLWWRVRTEEAPRRPVGAPVDGAVDGPVDGPVGGSVDRRLAPLAWPVAVAAALTLVVGTIVTGSGPHAGDLLSGKVRRTGLSPASVSQLHADVVMVLIGLTVGLVALVHVLRVAPSLRRAAVVLLGVELAQGVVGYAQYFLHLPDALVGVHMLGACLVWLAALNVLVRAVPALGARRLRTAG